MKGGVGKTTLAVNLAASAASVGKRTLLVDLDPQANASVYLLGSQEYRKFAESSKPSVVDILDRPPTLRTGVASLTAKEVIRSVPRWWVMGKNLSIIPSRLELSWSLKNPAQKEHRLARFLLREAADYDLILIDCAPTESMLTTAAYLASSYVLVPVVPEFLSAIGLPLLARSLDDFRSEYYDHEIDMAGIVFNAAAEDYSEHDESKRYVVDLAKAQGWYVFENELGFSRSYPRGPRAGTPITHTDYARYDVRDEFRAVATEFFKRIGL